MTDWSATSNRPDPAFERRLERVLLAELTRTIGAGSSDSVDGRSSIGRTKEPAVRRSRPPVRWLSAAAVTILVLGAVGLLLARRDASTPPGVAGVPIPVTFDVQWPALGGLETKDCIATTVTYEWAQDGSCWRTFVGEVTLSGDIIGAGLWAMHANLGVAGDERDSRVEVPSAFNGTYLVRADVDGCGSGEFMISEPLTFVGWASGQFTGTWQVVPGSGRGELASITGSGLVVGSPVDETDPDAPRTHVGTVSCE